MFKKIVYMFLIVMFLLVCFTACSAQTAASQSAGTQTGPAAAQATQAQTSSTPAPSVKDIYQIGDVADLSGIQIQIIKVAKNAGSEYQKPKSGDEFVIVTVNIKNTSGQQTDYNPLYFKMQNSQGQIVVETISADNSQAALIGGQLAAGGMVSGSMVFEQPKNDSGLKLIYTPLQASQSATFDLMNTVKDFKPLTADQSAQAANDYKIGDVGKLDDGCNVQVSKVQKSSGSDIQKPKSGNEFVIVTVSIKNTGTDKISYNPLSFTMKNSKSQIENMTFSTIDKDTALSSGDLAPGGLVSGTIVFEEPKNDAGLELIFDEDILSSNTITFNLNQTLDNFSPLK